jgi:hypothetical protein
MQSATRTRTRTSGPQLDPTYGASSDPVLDIELLHEEHGVIPLDGTPGAAREPGLRRYLRWKIRDFMRYRAAFLVPLALLAVWIFHHNYHPEFVETSIGARGDRGVGGLQTEGAVFRWISLVLGIVAGVGGSLLATAGVVSREREGGQQRFLFAKPVQLTWYYLQSLLVSGVGTVALVAFLEVMIAAAFGRTVPIGLALLGGSAGFMAVGGLTFLLSTLVRFDFAIAGLLSVLSLLLHAAAEQGKWWALATAWILPPLHKFEAFFPGSSRSGPAGMAGAILQLGAYGAAYVAAGVAVLRRRSIVR